MNPFKYISRIYNLHKDPIEYWRDKGAKIGEECSIYTDANLGTEPYLISIGNHVRINAGVQLITHDGGCWVLRDQLSGYGEKFKDADCFGKIVIDDNVHVGTNAVIMPGVHIGKNSIVGCGAVVTHDVPENTIVGGVPARKIESLDEYARKMRHKFANTKHMSLDEKRKYLIEKYDLDY